MHYVFALRFRWLTRFYDPVVAVTTREAIFRQRLLEQAVSYDGQRVLDLTCGSGTLAALVKRQYPQVSVIGLDGDPAIFTLARAKAKSLAGFLDHRRWMMRPGKHFWIVTLLLGLLFGTLVAGCGDEPTATPGHDHAMATMAEMPFPVQQSPVRVQEAYQFAVANPDALANIPCYCGCGSMGHTSNYSCYVAGGKDHGSLVFDEHALSCGICVDITQDVMRLRDQGKNGDEIFAAIDNTYARFGPPTSLR